MRVSGVVQGVGFRPFVYRLAHQYHLNGWVKNCTGQVEILVVGDSRCLGEFERDLIASAPAIARPLIHAREAVDTVDFDDFSILASEVDGKSDIHVPVDYFVCDDCLAELDDPDNRRFAYPFINCTQCGPRYTLIKALPYDRANTSMAAFELCPDCLREYTDMTDRRFHAEPVACPTCGPGLEFRQQSSRVTDSREALSACVAALRAGEVVAVKGVGGYHLMCSADEPEAIGKLRLRKPRPHKPLALMFPDIQSLEACVELSPEETRLLLSPARPIVLARRKAGAGLPGSIAPGLDEIGVMLPYSPLHHLLMNAFDGALVATSANISGEPVLTEADSVEQRLSGVVHTYLHHNRSIVRPADDPVYRTLNGRPRPLRLGRGTAPLEIRLPTKLSQPVLAVGGHMKNTVCLAFGDRAVISPHIGDMGTARSLNVFEQVVEDLQALYDVRAEALLCDAHPGYVTARWAHGQSLPVFAIQHHRAHASALIGEHEELMLEDCLVFTWDGVGLGDDRSLWGGEAFYGRPGHWRRQATWRPFRLPGADRAGRDPWRSAISLAWESGDAATAKRLFSTAIESTQAGAGYDLLYKAWQKKLNTPPSSAVGRLFDAAAALTGVCLAASFEGQGPMWLEARAGSGDQFLDLPLRERSDGVLESDWQPLYDYLIDVNVTVTERATVFHESLAEALLQQVHAVAQRKPVVAVGLCGGVFQNRRLVQACVQRLQHAGYRVVLGERLPVNDAALSFGQVIEQANR